MSGSRHLGHWVIASGLVLSSACAAPPAPRHAGGGQASAPADDEVTDPAAEEPAVPATANGDVEAAGEDDEPHAEALDDSGESAEPVAPEALSVRPHPLDTWSDAQIAAAVSHDLRSLGPMSLGSPNAGALINGVQASESALYKPISPSGAWSTQ